MEQTAEKANVTLNLARTVSDLLDRVHWLEQLACTCRVGDEGFCDVHRTWYVREEVSE